MVTLRIPRSLKIIAAIYLGYLALMTLVAMPLLNVMAPKMYREQTGRELHLQKIILLNPFTLAVTVREAASDNPDGSRFWAFDRLLANISIASIWQRHLVLDEFALQGLYVQVDQTAAARYNFSDIIDFRLAQAAKNPTPQNEQPPAQKDSAAVAISINKLEFSAQHLGLHAPHLSEPIAANIDDIRVTLDGLSTLPDNTATTPTLTIHSGTFVTDIKTIELKLLRAQDPFATQLRDLQIKLDKFSTSAAEAQPFTLALRDGSDGALQINGDVSVAEQTGSGSVQLRKLDLRPVWRYLADKVAFDTHSALLDSDLKFRVGWSGPLHYQISDGRVNLHAVQLQSRTDNDTHLQFGALRAEGINVDSAQPRAQIASVTLDQPVLSGWNRDTQISLLDMFAMPKNDEPSTTPPWQLQIDTIALNNGDIRWRASQIDKLPLHIAPLELRATNLRWPEAEPLHVELKAAINNEAKLAVNGDVVPNDLHGTLNATLDNVPLVWGDALLRPHMRATIVDGRMSAQAAIALADGKPTSIKSAGRIDQLALQQLPEHSKLLTWKQLQWHDLTLDPQRQQMRLRRIDITEPWARFHINPDGTSNFRQLLIAAQETSANKTPAAPANKTKASVKKHEAVADKNTADGEWKFAIDTIHIDRATFDVRDASLARQFRTSPTQFTGDIIGLNNYTNKPAKIALRGSVDGYAPVAITGSINPFVQPLTWTLALDVTNLDLAMLTPYSGTYAGFLIDGGRLSLQLAYTFDGTGIKGSNRIIVNQLQLGNEVSGPKVVDLPLRFAIYLLTDSDGVMNLDVDVTGSIDDPEFGVGNIIWKAVRNLIVKTVTSPFRALAALVGGNENDQLDRVEFAAGSDHIASDNADKLTKLTSALQKKPALNLSITGHVSPSRDLEALRDGALSSDLIADSKISAADIQTQSSKWQSAVVKLFKKRFPDQKSDALQPMQLNDWMRDNIELPPTALQELANNRALTVKQELVTRYGLDTTRASIKPTDIGADEKTGTHVTMGVN